jgi:pimeloyl-ACP methyl ester carboxylesterase
VALTREQFRYGFGNAISQEESDALFEKWTIPSPMRPLLEAAAAALAPRSPAAVDRKNNDRGPLLLTAGGKDHTVPKAVTMQTRKLYHKSTAVTDLHVFEDRGHSLTIDGGWREVADVCLDWLRRHGL